MSAEHRVVPRGCLSASEQMAKRQVDPIAWGAVRKDEAMPQLLV
jgi:hypothetical protein